MEEQRLETDIFISSLLNTILLVGVKTENGHNFRTSEPNTGIK